MTIERRCLKRILMTADAVGGVWQYSIDLLRCLADLEIEVLLAVVGPSPSEEQRQQAAQIPRVRLAEASFALEWMQGPWADVDRTRHWLAELEQQFHPDVIHLNGYALGSGAWKAPVLSVAHSCVYSWWDAVHGGEPGPEWREYQEHVTRGLRAAAAVVSPSQFMAGAVASHYGVDPQKTRVIHNFSLAPLPLAQAKEPFVLAAGRMWDPAKNLSLLESIAGRIDWPVNIAGGEGPAVQDSKLVRLGRLPHGQLLDRMSRAGIFAHPALYEPFGLAVLEAARAGCCLVLSDIPSLRELWDGAALFVSPRDEEGWTRELNRLTAHPSEVACLASAARSHAARYSAPVSVQCYFQLYESLVRGEASKKEVAA